MDRVAREGKRETPVESKAQRWRTPSETTNKKFIYFKIPIVSEKKNILERGEHLAEVENYISLM